MKGNVHHPDSGTFLFDHDFICDSAAEVSVVPIELVQKHGLRVYPTGKRVKMANGTDANCQGLVELLVKVGQNMCQLNFLVVGGVKIGILGLDAMGKLLGVVLNTKDKVVTLTGTPSKESGEKKADREEISSKCYHIRLKQSCDIKAFEERFIWGKFEDKNVHITNDAYIEGTEHFQERTGLLTAPIKASCDMIGKDKKIPICVLNVTDKPIRIGENKLLQQFKNSLLHTQLHKWQGPLPHQKGNIWLTIILCLKFQWVKTYLGSKRKN